MRECGNDHGAPRSENPRELGYIIKQMEKIMEQTRV